MSKEQCNGAYESTFEITWHCASGIHGYHTIANDYHTMANYFKAVCLKLIVSTYLENQNQLVLKYSRTLLKDFSQFPED